MDTIDLSDFFKTKAEAQEFAEQISSVVEKVYENNFNLEHALTEKLGVQKKDKIINMLRDNSVSTESNEEVKEFFGKILDKCSNISTLTITLAFEPDEKTMNILSEWCILNLGKQVVFAVDVDRSLIAGAKIFFNGKYFNFTIKPTFERIISEILSSKTLAQQKTEPVTQTKEPQIINQTAN